MGIEYARMQQRGATEAEILASAEIPLIREVIVATDTGRQWIGDGLRVAAALPSFIPVAPDQAYMVIDKTTNLPVDQGVLDALDSRFAAAGTGGDGDGTSSPVRMDYRIYDATTSSYPPAGNATADTLLVWIGPTPPPVNGTYARKPSTWWRTA